jgi:hypothetical protein
MPDKINFLVTLLAGKRLIPFRTQKLSPLRPMVVLTGESRSSPGFIKAGCESSRPFPLRCIVGEIMKKKFNAKRKFFSYTQSINEGPSKIFPLLCPRREYDWIKTWSCEIIYSDTGHAEDNCVFKTKSPGGDVDDIWVVCKYKKEKEIQFVRVDAFRTIRYNITLTKQKDGSTKAKWVQIITALNEQGNRMLQKMTPEIYAQNMSNIEKMLNHYLTNGTAL